MTKKETKPPVLCVDDTPNNLVALEAVLTRLDVTLIMAPSGKEAIELAKKMEFAVIIMDVMMPEMDGIETARRMREIENAKYTPIIFVTAHPLDEMRIFRGYALDAIDYIHKPLPPEVLESKVRVLVQLFQLREQVKEQAIEETYQRWEANRLRAEVEREALLRLFVENVKDYGVFLLDVDGKITSWNPACQAIFGYEEREIVGKDFSIIFLAEERNAQAHTRELQRAERLGRAEDERWHLRKDGERFWADGVVTSLRDRNGALRGFCKLVRDNTRRKQWEESLKISEDRFRMAVDSARLGTWDYNPITGDLEWSIRTKELCGLPPEAKITFETFLASVHPVDRPRIEMEIELALRGDNSGHYASEYRTIGIGDKILRWLYVMGHVYFNAEHRAVRFIGTAMEITEEKRAEEERIALIESLKGSNRQLESFASSASHDMQEPLRMISMYLSLLERRFRGQLDTEAEDYINIAVKASERMKRLTNDLLEYSRFFGTKAQVVPVALNSALQKALDNLSLTIKESGARIRFEELPTVRGNELQLALLFQNLISNAIKYRKKDLSPEIRVSVVQRDGEWILCLEDNGIGFDMEHREAIFEVFRRLHGKGEYEVSFRHGCLS